MLDCTYAEKVVKSTEPLIGSRNQYIDDVVDRTFSEEVISDLKTAIKQTKGIPLSHITPASVCKLLASSLLNKEYTSLPELFSRVDLRGMHVRLKEAKQPVKPKNKLVHGKNYGYRSENISYEYMVMKLGNCFKTYVRNDAFCDDYVTASKRYYTWKGSADLKNVEREAVEYVCSIPAENLCLVDVSAMICRHMCCQNFTDSQVYVDKILSRTKSNMELLHDNHPVFTYNLIPVGNSFRNTFLMPGKVTLNEYAWKRKHTGIWNRLLTSYGCSLFGRKTDKIQDVQQTLSILGGSPYANSAQYVCYILDSKDRLCARIFGVYTAGDFRVMFENALRYYRTHPNAFRSHNEKFDDICRLLKLSCVTATMKLETPEKYLDFAKTYSLSQLW